MQCFFEKKKTRNAMADNHPKIRFLKWSQSLIKLKVSFETIYWWTVEYYRCNGKHTVKNLHCQGPRRNPQSSNLICNLTCNLLDILSLKALIFQKSNFTEIIWHQIPIQILLLFCDLLASFWIDYLHTFKWS